MSKPKVCYKCPDRHRYCHSTCKKRAEEVAGREKEREAARNENILPLSRLKNLYSTQKTK
jgi:hypothetical protein